MHWSLIDKHCRIACFVTISLIWHACVNMCLFVCVFYVLDLNMFSNDSLLSSGRFSYSLICFRVPSWKLRNFPYFYRTCFSSFRFPYFFHESFVDVHVREGVTVHNPKTDSNSEFGDRRTVKKCERCAKGCYRIKGGKLPFAPLGHWGHVRHTP